MTPDLDLLREYIDHRSDSAFTELVRRHAGWVHAVARRRVRDDQLADDVTQAVFIVLSRKAPQLLSGRWNMRLTGWLYNVVRLTSASALREQSRRRRHERAAATQRSEQSQQGDVIDWEEVLPAVDASLADLRASDREAVLLRFYRQQSFTEVAHALGISEEAARKRVARAIERLRGLMSRRGQTSLAGSALAAGLWAGAVPASATAARVAAAVAGASMGSSTLAETVLTALAWKQTTVLTVLAAGLVVIIGGAAAVVLQVSAGVAPPQVQTAAAPAPVAVPATTQPAIDPVALKRIKDMYRTFLSLESAAWEMQYTQPENPPHFWGPKRTASVAFRRPNLCVVRSSDIRGDFWAMSDGKHIAWVKTAFRSEPGRGGWSVPDPQARTYLRMPAPPADDAIKRTMEDGQSDGFDYFRWMCARVEPLEFDQADHARLVSLAQGPAGELDGVATETVIATLYRPFSDPRYEGQFVITYEIGRDDHFLRRVTSTFTRTDGQAPPRTRTGRYTQVRINPDLPDEMFAIAPPAGLAPEDVRYGYDPKVVAVGALPPQFQTMDFDGQRVSLDDYRGKVLLLTFISPLRSAPRLASDRVDLAALYKKYHDQGLEVLTIGANSRGDRRYRDQELRALAESMDLPGRVAYDARRLVSDAWGIERSLTLVIGRDGRIAILDDDLLLERRLGKELEQAPAPAR